MRLRAVLVALAVPLAYVGGILASWRLDEGCGDLPEAQVEGSSWEFEWSWLPPHATCQVETATTTTVYYQSWEVVAVFFVFFLLLAGLVLAPGKWNARAVAVRGAIALAATLALFVWFFFMSA